MRSKPKSLRSVGAPSKLDAATKKTLLDEIRLGSSYANAARLAGVSPATVIGWRRRGESENEGEYFQFIEDLEGARADRRRYYRMAARDIAEKKGDLKATIWLASVTEPEEFSPQMHVFVEQQFHAAIDRLKQAFAADENLLERVLTALAGQDDNRLSASAYQPTMTNEVRLEIRRGTPTAALNQDLEA